MRKSQLAALIVCLAIPYAVSSGILSLLPIYATRLGADPGSIGLYFAFAFFAQAVSSIVVGPLSDRLQQRKGLLIVGGIMAALGAALMSQASSLLAIMLLVAVVWFGSGIVMAMTNVLAGLFAPPGERGRVFGILGLAPTLGVILGGVGGVIVDRWGFPALFIAGAGLYAVVPLVGLLLHDRIIVTLPTQGETTSSVRTSPFANRTFVLLFFASILTFIGNSEIVMGRPLIMNDLAFEATAISSAASIGALVMLPLPALVGVLSDRLGRKPFMILCVLGSTFSLLVLTMATGLWHFWVATILQMMTGSALIVGAALITDMIPEDTLGNALSLYGATQWIAFVIGFAGTGVAINVLTITPTLLIGAALTLAAVGLLLLVQTPAARLRVKPA